MGELRKARIYDEKTKEDGVRILADRLWPRGVKKEDAQIDEWAKEIAPSNELRKSYHGGELNTEEFQSLYRGELRGNEQTDAFIGRVEALLEEENVTLLSAAKNLSVSHIPVLEEFIRERRRK